MLTLDIVFRLLVAIARVYDTFYNVVIQQAFTVLFASDHVLLELFWLPFLASMNVHVGHNATFEVVVQLAPAFTCGDRAVFLPCGMIVSFVLPFDL